MPRSCLGSAELRALKGRNQVLEQEISRSYSGPAALDARDRSHNEDSRSCVSWQLTGFPLRPRVGCSACVASTTTGG